MNTGDHLGAQIAGVEACAISDVARIQLARGVEAEVLRLAIAIVQVADSLIC